MKLRNKKTGEIIDVYKGQVLLHYDNGRKTIHFKSLEELEEWEDYEESETFYIVEHRGNVGSRFRVGGEYEKKFKEIGNYFGTKEEAEKAVEKLKAWKRLKDKGFKFTDWYRDVCEVSIQAEIHDEGTMGMINELNLLFGGEE